LQLATEIHHHNFFSDFQTFSLLLGLSPLKLGMFMEDELMREPADGRCWSWFLMREMWELCGSCWCDFFEIFLKSRMLFLLCDYSPPTRESS
jgi:hypothetical protein